MEGNENQEVTVDSPKKSSNMTVIVVSVVALLLLLGGFWVAQNRQTNSNGSVSNTMPADGEGVDEMVVQDDSMVGGDAMVGDEDAMGPEDAMEDDAMMEGAEVVEVEGGSFYFDPNEITVKAGQEVKIVLNSVDMMHDFVIDELDVKTEIAQAGETVEVTFTAPNEVGEYEYYCSVGAHRANGMVGTLVVTE